MHNILIPTDFSPISNNAVNIALQIAQKADAEVHFLHGITTPIDWERLKLQKEDRYPELKHQIGHAKGELSKLVNKAESLGLKAKQFLYFNKGREDLVEHLQRHHHDFLVMGSHGTKGGKELIIGSNTQKIIRNAPCPVLVVKQTPVKQISRIVFASNFHNDVQQPFNKVVELADLMGAEIHLLYVNMPFQFEETDQSKANMELFLKRCPRGGTCSMNIYNAFNEDRGIQKFTEEIHADLIALTTHGRKGFMRMIAPSITESLVNHSKIPVLSVNIGNI